MINKITKSTFAELLVYSILLAVSRGFFPICNYYYLDYNEEMKITKPQYFKDFGVFSYIFPLFYILVIMGFLSFKKGIVISVNIIVIFFMLLTFSYIKMEFLWWGGSPFHPDFQEGYWLSQLVILVAIIRTFTLVNRFNRNAKNGVLNAEEILDDND